MKYRSKYLHCGEILLESMEAELHELFHVLEAHPWSPDFSITTSGDTLRHQAAYNKSLSIALSDLEWRTQPRLSDSPRLIGDFAKGLVFGEIQFGNSATLYRDFYKFQYGLQNGLLSLAVLIVPHDECKFFPTRRGSVRNMANFTLALRYFTVLLISVPTIICGLLADDEEVPDQALHATGSPSPDG